MTHGIFIIRRCPKQQVTRKGLCILEWLNLYFLHSIFCLMKFTNNENIVCRHHYYAVIWIFYNKHIKMNGLSNPLRGIRDHLLIYFTIGIDSISINSCWPIYILLVQFTSIERSLKHTNKPFNTKKTLPIITFFPDPHNGFAILQINIIVDVSSNLRNFILPYSLIWPLP